MKKYLPIDKQLTDFKFNFNQSPKKIAEFEEFAKVV